jgi:hypothetical protein
MQKKVTLIVGNRTIRVMEHQVEDAISKFGATRLKKEIRQMPTELLKIPELKKVEPEVSPLPEMQVTKNKGGRPKAAK